MIKYYTEIDNRSESNPGKPVPIVELVLRDYKKPVDAEIEELVRHQNSRLFLSLREMDNIISHSINCN
jgi:hypothetical protein